MKKEIEFDFAKWGQEGIIVEVNGAKIATLHKHTLISNAYYGIYDSSSFNPFCLYGNNFKMIQEVKPREFWVNEYDDGSFGVARLSKEETESKRVIGGDTKLIKLVEVIE